MRYIERTGLHPLKVDLSAWHPLDDEEAKAHALYRCESEFGEDNPFALFAARKRQGEWQVQQIVGGHRPPFEQAMQAGEMCVELNKRLNPTFGGCWILALGDWRGPAPGNLMLLGPDGAPLRGGYDRLVAWWCDADADRPWLVMHDSLLGRGFPPLGDMLETCAKGDAKYDAWMRDLEIDPRLTRKAAKGQTVH